MKRALVASACAIALTAIALPHNGAAFRVKRPGSPDWLRLRPSDPPPFVRWDLREFPNCRVPYTINPNCDDVLNEIAMVASAASKWNACGGLLSLYAEPWTSTIDTSLNDNYCVVFWCNDFPIGDPFLATTHSRCDGNSRSIDIDIYFNDRHYIWVDDAAAGEHRLGIRGGSGPFDMSAIVNESGPHLTVTFNFNDVRHITFNAADFPDPANVTRQQIRPLISNRLGGPGPTYQPACATATESEGHSLVIQSLPLQATGIKTRYIKVEGPAKDTLRFESGTHCVSKVDVEALALHEMGHYLGLADLYETTSAHGGAEVMYGYASFFTAKRALHDDERDGALFLYGHDAGDADDPFRGFNRLPSVVRGGSGRTLNGVQLRVPALGAMHLYGKKPVGEGNSYNYEWLGTSVDADCETKQINNDLHDDGVILTCDPMAGSTLEMQVLVSTGTDAQGGFHDYGSQPLYLNIWADFDEDGVWSPSERVVGPGVALNGPGVVPVSIGIPLLANDSIWVRVRLDWGEDCGASGWNDIVTPGPTGAAQFGEVEDYLVRPRPYNDAIKIINDAEMVCEQTQSSAHIPFAICNSDACGGARTFGYHIASTGSIGMPISEWGSVIVAGGASEDVFGILDASTAEVGTWDLITCRAWTLIGDVEVADTGITKVYVIEPQPVPMLSVQLQCMLALMLLIVSACFLKRIRA
jgi:hypothetical protein